jgi:hypothetical protein
MLPSKKVLSLLVLATALVASIIIVFGKDKSSQAINYASNLVAGEKVTVPENPNWQNELNGVSTLAKTVTTSTEVATAPETVTDTVSKSLLSNYLVLKQNGTLDQTSAQNLVDQTVNYIQKTGGQVTRISEINLVADNGKQSIKEYGENLGKILKENKPQTIKNEVDIIKKAAESGDISKLNDLDSIIAVYEDLNKELVKMPVPKTFVTAHLDLVNGIMGMATALKEMKTTFNDPVKSLSSMQLYQEGTTIFVQALQATRVFITQNNIVYEQGSGGYYLLYGL